MKVAVYDYAYARLRGTIEATPHGLVVEPCEDDHAGNAPEANRAWLEKLANGRFREDGESDEDYLRELPRRLRDRVAVVPDGAGVDDVWPGFDLTDESQEEWDARRPLPHAREAPGGGQG